MSLVSYAAKLAIRPQGPVELALFDHIWAQTPVQTVLAELMRAEVHLFAQSTAEAIAAGADPKPLVMQARDGNPAILVFTSLGRCAAIARQMPDPAAAPLTMPFKDVLRWVPIELGLAINSGSALAAECTPAQMNELRKQTGIFRP
ncbi:MAG TPA: SseB family protein [Burkholderiales bacterium]|nr:SseB family protein [Burkholderiales bacterium]